MMILENVKVLDLSQIMAGPLCSMVLGDLGADVIKIEPPEGDAARSMGDTFIKGEAGVLLSLNRNKRSIVINLKTHEGRNIFFRMVREADVVIENFRPGVVQKLGIDYKTVSKVNPKIIYCSVAGYGQSGPYKDRPAMDPIIQAMGGIMGITGFPETGPVKVGAPITDLVAPLLATIGIIGALLIRDRSGKGQKIDISMLDGAIFSIIGRENYFFIKGKKLPLTGNRNFHIAPANSYLTKDEEYIMVIAHTQKHWVTLCESLGIADLANDSKFKTNPERVKNVDELDELMGKIFLERTQDEWVKYLSSKGVMAGPVYTFEKLFNDPQVLHDEIVQEVDHPVAGKINLLKTPINLHENPPKIRRPPPVLGQHTREILLEMGYSEEEIEDLKITDVIKGS